MTTLSNGRKLDCILPEHLYIGPFPLDTDVAALKALGIQSILSLIDDTDPVQLGDHLRREFACATVPVRGAFLGGAPTIEDLADAVAVLRRWKGEARTRFYVHCVNGNGRAAVACMAYLVNGFDGPGNMALTKAIAHVNDCRPEVDPSPAQLRVLAEYVQRAGQDINYHPANYRISSRTLVRRPEDRSRVIMLRQDPIKDRYRGALVGLATGDALGVPLEFKVPGTFRPVSEIVGGGPFNLKPGEWTDDTSMALCLAESLLTKRGFDAKDQLDQYVAWYRDGHLSSKGKCFDIGGTVSAALHAYERTGRTDVGQTHARSAGNGSIMRLAPVPMYFRKNPSEALRYCAESSATTHALTVAKDACRYFGGLIIGALNGVTKDVLLSENYSPLREPQPLCAEIAAIAQGSFKRKHPPEIVGSGYVVASLEAALWAFYHGRDFEDGCQLAVNLGDDADTTGAIYGQLAGAFYGESQIPARWTDRLVNLAMIQHYAEALYDAQNN